MYLPKKRVIWDSEQFAVTLSNENSDGIVSGNADMGRACNFEYAHKGKQRLPQSKGKEPKKIFCHKLHSIQNYCNA